MPNGQCDDACDDFLRVVVLGRNTLSVCFAVTERDAAVTSRGDEGLLAWRT